MPQVQSDPALNQIITNGGEDLFSFPNVAQPSVLDLQTDSTQPLPPGTDSATQLLVPDLHVDTQLRNFPSTVYDTSPTSLLSHFMRALLGAPGVGQLRNRQMIARLQQAITSTHFYDLDSFYGALFGATRGPNSALPTNPATGTAVSPYTDLASPDGWDEVEAIDAMFRERIIALARAITLGATVPGMRAIGEAITGVPCQVYETFRLLQVGGEISGNTWLQVETAYSTWSAIPPGTTWAALQGNVTFTGLLGNGAPNEIVIRPRKTYTTSPADLIAQGSEHFGILSVAEVLKPAASLVSVDTGTYGIVEEAPIASAWSDSEYCEITHLVTPADASAPGYQPALAAYQQGGALVPTTYIQPRPPFTRSEGGQYSDVSDVAIVTGQGAMGDDPNNAAVTNGQDFQTVVFPQASQANPGGPSIQATVQGVPGGSFVLPPVIEPIPAFKVVTVQYLPQKAIKSAAKAQSARTTSPAAVQAAPYSGPRVPVVRAT